MNKLISLGNRVIEKGLANPVNFRRSVSKDIEELLEDVKSDYVWALDYFLFRVYESIWLGDQSLYSQPYVSFPTWFCVSTNSALCLDSINRLPWNLPSLGMFRFQPPSAESRSPVACASICTSAPTNTALKVPPWSVPMPWNFDKERDIFDNYAAIPLYLQGMTIRVDWPTYTIRPALTRAQERRLEETSPEMEMAKLHMFGHRMILACARLNDWVRCMNQRQLIPLHIFLAGTVLADNPGHFGYNAVRKMGEGYEKWREDPHGYRECIRPSDVFEEDERSSSSESNPWEEEDRAWSDGDEGWQQD